MKKKIKKGRPASSSLSTSDYNAHKKSGGGKAATVLQVSRRECVHRCGKRQNRNCYGLGRVAGGREPFFIPSTDCVRQVAQLKIYLELVPSVRVKCHPKDEWSGILASLRIENEQGSPLLRP